MSSVMAAHAYWQGCLNEVYKYCGQYQLAVDHIQAVNKCRDRTAMEYPDHVANLMGFTTSYYNRFVQSVPTSDVLQSDVGAGREAGKNIIGPQICDPNDPNARRGVVRVGQLDLASGGSSGTGEGGTSETNRSWALRIGAGAAGGGIAWYFLNRTGGSGGSGTGSGGGRVVELRPRRQPFQASTPDAGQKAARVAVGGGILTVLGAAAVRLLTLTPQGAAAGLSLMMSGAEKSDNPAF